VKFEVVDRRIKKLSPQSLSPSADNRIMPLSALTILTQPITSSDAALHMPSAGELFEAPMMSWLVFQEGCRKGLREQPCLWYKLDSLEGMIGDSDRDPESFEII